MISDNTCAVFTLARDEALRLPVWLRYYKKHFAPQNIYVFDHESTDDSTFNLDVSVIQVRNSHYNDIEWLTKTVKAAQAFLLSQYKYVLFAGPDEFVVADPIQCPRGGLAEYIARNTQPIVRCNGWAVIQNLSQETQPIDWSRRVFDQRRWWCWAMYDCKPLLASQPVNWCHGFHWEDDHPDRQPDPALLMVHLHRADMATLTDRYVWLRQQQFHDNGPLNQASFHQQWSDEEVIKDMQSFQDKLAPIPERFNGSIL